MTLKQFFNECSCNFSPLLKFKWDMKLPVLFSFVMVCILSVSCTKSKLSDDSAIAIENPSSVPTTVNKSVMLQLVNDVRKAGCQCGDTYYYPAPAVSWNAQLEAAAYEHSEDMYTNNYFNHTALDGSNGGVRIERAGYDWATFGENIAMGYRTEKDVVNDWLQSPGHCKNIMNRNFKEMGVARVGNYWTQEFGAKTIQ
jgi:uncharacterized protein YkwD